MILLTALPHTGKSTAIKKIIELLGISNCGGFYTEEIRKNDERVGFMIKTLSNKEGVLAHTNLQSEYKISRYGVDVTKFEELCLGEINKSINDNNIKYIIIDEIGPMELFSNRYKELIKQSDKKERELNLISLTEEKLKDIIEENKSWWKY